QSKRRLATRVARPQNDRVIVSRMIAHVLSFPWRLRLHTSISFLKRKEAKEFSFVFKKVFCSSLL
ncbi:MAG TPA: hypothetical protein PKB13_12655, partial [Clostridia bacterium]|nr:hypothetical protein [Clostridia bacterium]